MEEEKRIGEACRKIGEAKESVKLDLANYEIGSKNCKAELQQLATALKEAKQSVTVDMTNCNIGNDAAQTLASVLAVAICPIQLILAQNDLGRKGNQALAGYCTDSGSGIYKCKPIRAKKNDLTLMEPKEAEQERVSVVIEGDEKNQEQGQEEDEEDQEEQPHYLGDNLPLLQARNIQQEPKKIVLSRYTFATMDTIFQVITFVAPLGSILDRVKVDVCDDTFLCKVLSDHIILIQIILMVLLLKRQFPDSFDNKAKLIIPMRPNLDADNEEKSICPCDEKITGQIQKLSAGIYYGGSQIFSHIVLHYTMPSSCRPYMYIANALEMPISVFYTLYKINYSLAVNNWGAVTKCNVIESGVRALFDAAHYAGSGIIILQKLGAIEEGIGFESPGFCFSVAMSFIPCLIEQFPYYINSLSLLYQNRAVEDAGCCNSSVSKYLAKGSEIVYHGLIKPNYVYGLSRKAFLFPVSASITLTVINSSLDIVSAARASEDCLRESATAAGNCLQSSVASAGNCVRSSVTALTNAARSCGLWARRHQPSFRTPLLGAEEQASRRESKKGN